MKAGVLDKEAKTLSNLISTLAFVQILQSWKLAYVSLLFFVLPVFLPSFLLSLRAFFGRSVRFFARPAPVRLSVCLYVFPHVCLSISAGCVCLSVSQFFPSSLFLCASRCSPEDSIFGSGNQVSEFAYTPLRTHWHDLKWHLQDQTPVDSRQQSLLLSLTSHTYLQRGKK